jgi:hypothetical protein
LIDQPVPELDPSIDINPKSRLNHPSASTPPNPKHLRQQAPLSPYQSMVDSSLAGARSRSSSVSTTSSSAALPTFEALAPPRLPTTIVAEETVLEIPFLDKEVRLKVDAGPGCGGIAWPAGIVCHFAL